MRIAYNGRFLSTPKITGVERVAYNLLKNLVKNDKNNEYFIFAGNSERIKGILDYPKVTFIKCYLHKNRILRHLWEQICLPFLVKKYKCDILFNPVNTAPIYGVEKSILFLCDVSFLINPEWFSKSFRYMYCSLIPVLVKKVKKIITISKSSKEDIVKYLKVKDSKVEVVYPAVDEKFNNKKLNKNKDVLRIYNIREPFILFTGSLEPRKNLVNLIKSFIELKKSTKIKHKLVIVGVRNPNFHKLELKIDKIINDILLLGYVNDEQLKVLYQEADVFIYPSLYEGFGLPPLEAMASGCPVVVSNNSSLPEICGDAAIYIDPYSVESIAKKIYNILDDENLKTFLVKKGLERIKLFNWEEGALKMLKIFEEVKQL